MQLRHSKKYRMTDTLEHLKYPIGKYIAPTNYDAVEVQKSIQYLEEFPTLLRTAVNHFTTEQLNTPYREGGWTVKQVLHHIPDSHINAYIRFKLGLTENNPVIKPYLEAEWANLYDSKVTDISVSLTLTEAIHHRFTNLLKGMSEADFKRTVVHPQYQKTFTLWDYLALYHWHSKHHLAHITELSKRMNWV